VNNRIIRTNKLSSSGNEGGSDRLYFLHCLLIQRRHGGAYRFLTDRACATVELPEVAWGPEEEKDGPLTPNLAGDSHDQR
jgi:hypothetical protein